MLSNLDRVQPGWTVITADRESVGEIESIGTAEMLVRKGWLFPTDRNLPLNAIRTVDPIDQQVHLSITKEQVERLADGSWTMEDLEAERGTWGTGAATSDVVTNDLDAPVADAGYDTAPAAGTVPAAGREETQRIETHEERLQARPVERQAGEVEVRTEVSEETQTIDVPVRREEVVVERHPSTGATGGAGTIDETPESIRVPVMEEEVEVNKVVRPVEEVEISKRVTEDRETVSGTVRREEVRVEGEDVTETRDDLR